MCEGRVPSSASRGQPTATAARVLYKKVKTNRERRNTRTSTCCVTSGFVGAQKTILPVGNHR